MPSCACTVMASTKHARTNVLYTLIIDATSLCHGKEQRAILTTDHNLTNYRKTPFLSLLISLLCVQVVDGFPRKDWQHGVCIWAAVVLVHSSHQSVL